MIDIQFIRKYPDLVQQNADKRRISIDVQAILRLDEWVRSKMQEVDVVRAERNTLAEQLATSGGADAEAKERGRLLKNTIARYEEEYEQKHTELQQLLWAVPNMTHPDSPIGRDDSENVEVRRFQEPTSFVFTPKNHVELAADLDIIDFEKGADVTGSGFYYLKNEAVLLELALVQYALNVCISEGFSPMITPDIAKQEILQGTGYNPRGDETQIYTIEGTDLSLIATAEITVAGYYRNHVFTTDELKEPKKIVAISHCFRTEAGSYGRESRGLYRVHQFTKVEMFIFCRPGDSERMHEELLRIEEKIMQGLEIPYRVVDICTGDLGGPAYRKYDIEAWMPSKEGWGEVTSASNCTDYQSRRLRVQYIDAVGKKQLVHTLNGTALAASRTPIAIMENFQQADGSIRIPTILHSYMLGVQQIQKKARP